MVQQQELADRLNLDQTVAANGTRLKRWLNLAQQDIAARHPFEWLYKRAYVQTIVDRTAGTVAITNGAAAVTGTGTAFATTDVRSFIRFEGDTNWYEVTARASTTAITIGNNFQGATLTAGTYTLRTVYYNLPTDVVSIYDARQSNSPLKLTNLGVWTMDTYQPDINTTGKPTAYYRFRLDPEIAVTAAKAIQVGFFPSPDDEYNIEFRYIKQLVDLSADTDLSEIPAQFHTLMIDGAEWLGAKFLNDPDENKLKTAYEFGLAALIDRENAHGDWMPVLGSTDTQNTSRFLPFPTTFEQPR